MSSTGQNAVLLMSFRSVFKGDPAVKRWIDDGEVVEFTKVNFTSRNAEYEINHNQNHKIWFSQLDDIFINPFAETKENQTVVISLFEKMPNLQENPQNFWAYVKNKRFRVSVNTDYSYVIDWDSPICSQFVTYQDALDYYFENFKKGNFEAIKGMLKHSRCYKFEKI